MGELHFLYAVDSNYFCHMLTSIYSLAIHHKKENVIIHIISDGFDKDQLMKLIRFQNDFPNIDFRFYNIDKLKKLMEQVGIPKYHETTIPNARLFSKELITETNKILYLDSDTIINRNLKDVFNKGTDKPIFAVKEVSIPMHMRDKTDKYYNSGVLLFNYDNWHEDYYKKMNEAVKKTNTEFLYPDQDIMCLAFQDNIGVLDFKYNIYPFVYNIMRYPHLAKQIIKKIDDFYSYEEILKALKNPSIYHMISFFGRPWEQNKVNPYNKKYDKYRNLWDKNYEKEDKSSLYANNKLMPIFETLMCAILSLDGYIDWKVNVKDSDIYKALKLKVSKK